MHKGQRSGKSDGHDITDQGTEKENGGISGVHVISAKSGCLSAMALSEGMSTEMWCITHSEMRDRV
jgi:hypothetical protein